MIYLSVGIKMLAGNLRLIESWQKANNKQWEKTVCCPIFRQYTVHSYVFHCWEKCHLHFGCFLEQWSRFHDQTWVVLHSGKSLWTQTLFLDLKFFDCKLQMVDEMFLQTKTSYTLRMTGTGWGQKRRSFRFGAGFCVCRGVILFDNLFLVILE